MAGIGKGFRDRVKEANPPDGLSAHDLRKAACRRLAEAGNTAPQILSISGHRPLEDVQTYLQAANRLGLAHEALKYQITVDENRKKIVKPGRRIRQFLDYIIDKKRY